MQIERFVEIKGAPGYKISDHGRIIGRRGREIRVSKNQKGYFIFVMPIKDLGKTFNTSVHRLVAEHFVGGDFSLQVNHKDGNKLNNHFSNLEFVSCRDNIRHAISIGLRKNNANLTDNRIFDAIQIKTIKKCIDEGIGNQDLASYFKCHHSTISKIRTGINYSLA